MRRAVPSESASGWVTATLRWLWGADDDVGLRELFASAPATWIFLGIFSAVSIGDFVLAGSLTEVGPLTDRLGTSPAAMADGQWWRFATTTLINAPELDPPANGLQHLAGNALPFVITGPRVERTFGSLRAVVVFVVATICGAVAIYVGAPFYWEASGGTSNAVYGFIGATLVIAYLRRRRSSRDAIFFGGALFAVGSLALAATAFPTGTNVSHLAGLIAGSVIAAVWYTRPAARRAGAAVAAAFVVVAGSVAAARTADVRNSDLGPTDEIAVGFAPVMVTPGFGSLWVTGGREGDPDEDVMVRIDQRSGRVTARIGEDGIGGLPVVTDDRIWVAGKGYVAAIDPASNRVVSRVRLSGGAWPWSLAATEDALWAAASEPGEVIRIDLRTGEQKHISVGAETFVVAAHGRNVWATSYRAQTLSRLDPVSGRVLERKRLSTGPYQMAVLDGSLWVGAQPFVYRLDPASLEVEAEIDFGTETWTLGPDPAGMLLVTQRFSRTVAVLDPATNEVERRIQVGLRQPISATFAGHDLWIADAFEKSVIRTSVPS